MKRATGNIHILTYFINSSTLYGDEIIIYEQPWSNIKMTFRMSTYLLGLNKGYEAV